jgi:hypothetical protein
MSSDETAIGAGGIISAKILVPKVGVRDYFSMEHLWNARHNAQLCEEREAARPARRTQSGNEQTPGAIATGMVSGRCRRQR